MKGNAADVSIDTNITYSLKTNSFNKHLKLVNKSAHTYVFKVHDFSLRSKLTKRLLSLFKQPTISSSLTLSNR